MLSTTGHWEHRGVDVLNVQKPVKSSVPRSEAIDVLRGVAIFMVMICHLPFSLSSLSRQSEEIFPAPWLADILEKGHYGVQLFLVISGFCIHMRWANLGDLTKGVDFVSFWKRRFARLYPPYLAILGVSLAISYVGQVLPYKSLSEFALDLFFLLFMMQNLNNSSERVGNGVFWSLALEEQLYLLYFPLLWMRRNWGWRKTCLLVMLVSVCWLGVSVWVPSDYRNGWFRAAPAYWFSWTLGALAVEASCGLIRLPSWTASATLGMIAFVFGFMLPQPLQQFVVTGSFFFWLRFVLEQEKKSGNGLPRLVRPMLRLGYISYSVYLVHNLAFIVTKRVLLEFTSNLSLILLSRFAAGVLAGMVVYILVERPALRFSRRFPVK